MLQLIVFYFYFETLDLGAKEALKPKDNVDLNAQEAQILQYRTSIFKINDCRLHIDEKDYIFPARIVELDAQATNKQCHKTYSPLEKFEWDG